MTSWKQPGWVVVYVLLFAFQASAQQYGLDLAKRDTESPPQHHFSGCDADHHQELLLHQDPTAASRFHSYEYLYLQSLRTSPPTPSTSRSTLTVPVVVHVIHNNSVENISAQQVLTAISQLNAAFANVGPYTTPSGTSIDIDFCLAQRDPQGQPTNGINRVATPLTVFTRETQDAQMKGLSQWPTDQYLNIWVVRDVISQAAGAKVAGYATFPFMHGTPNDGIVIEFNYFGTTPNSSKVLAHEVGHYLGLYHTFEGGCKNDDCQVDGDRVCDTPPDGSTAAATTFVNSCQSDGDDQSNANPFRSAGLGGLGDQPDPFDNYMDYGALTVLAKFTPGQKDRMRGQLLQFRASLLNNLACTTPCLTQVQSAFSTSADTVVIGSTINFTNQSSGASTFIWSVNGSQVSTAQNYSQTFNQTGFYTIQLEAGNGQNGCERTIEKTVLVKCDAEASFIVNKSQLLPGETLNLTSTSSNANQFDWLFNGNVAGTGASVSTQFSQPGGIGIQLVATSSQCQDSSAIQFIEVSRCGVDMHTLSWIFGDSAGFKVTSDSTLPLAGGKPDTYEGCASISDENGNLLFYSNGSTVWDRANFPMVNGTGLIGNKSASQGVVIVPWPGNPLKYFLFTSDAIENTFFQGLRYSVVDMSVSNGLGDIDPAQKNVMLGTFKCEMVAAVQHDNGRDFWLVTHEAFNNNFNSFLITPAGVNPVPVVTPLGPSMMLPTGAFKVSPNREKVAISMNEINTRSLAVLDFDATTGKFANPFYVPINPTRQVYGVEWSPDNSKVYFTTLYDLFQIDMTQPTPQDIINSQTLIYGSQFLDALSLQRAENGNIYVTAGQVPKLHVIAQPNEPGPLCGFQFQGYDLHGANGFWGLPNFYVSQAREVDFVELNGPMQFCEGAAGAVFEATKTGPGQSIQWSLNRPGNVQPNTVSDSLAEIVFDQAGLTAVVAERSSNCGISQDTVWVDVLARPQSTLVDDTTVCPGTLFPLTASNDTATTFQWNTGATSPTIFPAQPGPYAVRMENSSGCVTEDSLQLDFHPANVPVIDLGSDTSVCEGSVVILDADQGTDYDYLWQDGSNLPSLTTTSEGTYFVEVTDICGNVARDTVVVRDTNTVYLNLGPENQEICDTVELTVGADYSKVLWEDGSTSGDRKITQPGTYSVEVTSTGGCIGRDTITYLPCTSVNVLHGMDMTFQVFPNPTSGPARVRMEGLPIGQQAELDVVDALGRILMTQACDDQELAAGVTLPLEKLAAGMYYVRLTLNGQEWQERIQVLR